MARTTPEIYDEIVEEKNTYAELQDLQPNIDSSQKLMDDLSNPARVGEWRLFTWVVARGMRIMEELFDAHKRWIEKRAGELRVGNTAWYSKLAREFQYGDALVWNASKLQYEYPVQNPSNKIVKLAASIDTGSLVLIKVAKLTGSEPEQLTTPELDALTEYLQKRKVAGVKLNVVSREADLMRCYFNVYYDPLVMASDGSLISSPSVYPVHDAIENYLKNLPFDGILNITELTDKLQLAEGVVNPIFVSASAKFGLQPYVSVIDYYQSNAGYLRIDPNFPLSATITYIPQP